MSNRRTLSKSNIYHVIARGTGRQLIYEDDEDRRVFLCILSDAVEKTACDLYAWCLMGNHFHLLIHGEMERVSKCMQRLCGEYAHWFNKRTDRVGHLFQARFRSEAVDTEAYLLTVIRYIHHNPEKGGICATSKYRWSSYNEYVNKEALCKTLPVLSIIGGRQEFARFHEDLDGSVHCLDVDRLRDRFHISSEDDLIAAAQETTSHTPLSSIKSLSKPQRNACIRSLKDVGFTIRQIERLTGIGRNIVARA